MQFKFILILNFIIIYSSSAQTDIPFEFYDYSNKKKKDIYDLNMAITNHLVVQDEIKNKFEQDSEDEVFHLQDPEDETSIYHMSDEDSVRF